MDAGRLESSSAEKGSRRISTFSLVVVPPTIAATKDAQTLSLASLGVLDNETPLPLPNNCDWIPQNLRASSFAKALVSLPDCFLSVLQPKVGGEFDIALGQPKSGYAIRLKFSEPSVEQVKVPMAGDEICRRLTKVVMFAQIMDVDGKLVFSHDFVGKCTRGTVGSRMPEVDANEMLMLVRQCLLQLADLLSREFSSCYCVGVRLSGRGQDVSDLHLRALVDDVDVALGKPIRLDKGKHVVKVVTEEGESKSAEINFTEVRDLYVSLVR